MGVDVAISVSDSSDLATLGLAQRHVELTIGEIARAVLLGGGRLTYGGRLKPSGFTQVLMHEVRRFGLRRHSVTFCLAAPEHSRMTVEELDQVDRDLGTWGRLKCLDADGREIPLREAGGSDLQNAGNLELGARALSGLRNYIASNTDARVVVGGRLTDYEGVMPGVIEEVVYAINCEQPVYVCGGFGGAAAAIARTLDLDDLSWAPPDFPQYASDERVRASLDAICATTRSSGWVAIDNGLTAGEARQLCASHRPGEIASLVAVGLGRRFQSNSRDAPR